MTPLNDDETREGHADAMLFEQPYSALVIGASGAIGAAFFDAFQKDPWCQHVHGVSRGQGLGFDLSSEPSIIASATHCRSWAPFQVIVDATGALSIDGVGPEKSLSALDPVQLHKLFQINAIGPALVLKHFSSLLAPGLGIYAKLSARVGSISDNKKGGWYGYRASKAALNMVLQTTALELQRKNPELRIVALQPGTVSSNLSKPFTAGMPTLLTPQASVAGLLLTMKSLRSKAGAHFVDYKGQDIAW